MFTLALIAVPSLAAIDSFWIMVAIAIGSALVEWYQRRHQKRGGEQPGQELEPPMDTPRPAAPGEDWQAELRRLLEGERAPQSPPPSAPPPVVVVPYDPKPAAEPEPKVTPPVAPPIIRPSKPVVISNPRPVIDWEDAAAPSAPLAHLTESAAAHHRVGALEEQALQRMLAAANRTEHPHATLPPPRRAQFDPAVAEVHAWLREPRTTRQAVMASVILGPPRGLPSAAQESW